MVTQTTSYDNPGTIVFMMAKILEKFQWGHPQWGRQIEVGRLKASIFYQYLVISQKLWKANRNAYALYRMALFSVTLGNPYNAIS